MLSRSRPTFRPRFRTRRIIEILAARENHWRRASTRSAIRRSSSVRVIPGRDSKSNGKSGRLEIFSPRLEDNFATEVRTEARRDSYPSGGIATFRNQRTRIDRWIESFIVRVNRARLRRLLRSERLRAR